MAKLTKRKQDERAHQYNVIADRLGFHLAAGNLPRDVEGLVQHAREALLAAAAHLEQQHEQKMAS
jgi:hypothetical protein